MNTFVTITSQGQITIPARFRRAMGLKTRTKARLALSHGKLTIEPSADFQKLQGSLAKYAMKGKSADETMRIEEDAIGEAVAEKYRT